MRILHTSDWHIGKRLAGKERLDEQSAVLEEIADICARERVELVLVAGDVFDTFMPSAEAENLFYRAARRIAAGERCVLAVSGNHDDPVRLSAATALSEELGIYIYGSVERRPRPFAGAKVSAVEAGPDHIVFENAAGERVFVHVLPYPNEARLKEDKNPDESFQDKMRRWIAAGENENKAGLPSVFLSHLFVAGGQVSEGEREIDLGGARAVPLDLLPACDYVALGHLHKKQRFRGGTVRYSGSIMQYAFDEAGTQKSVVVFDLDKSGVHDMREVPLCSGKKLVRLESDGVEAGAELLRRQENCYIELTLHLREPLSSDQVRALKEANAGLVNLIPDIRGEIGGRTVASRKSRSAGELFSEFYRAQFAEEPGDALKELFLSAVEEAEHEA